MLKMLYRIFIVQTENQAAVSQTNPTVGFILAICVLDFESY